QKPILLQGHERSITQIKYNREGDLLFTVAKDPIVNVWYSVNGERLGTYNGHTGAVWCVDADWDTRHVLTGSADNSCRLWDCETAAPASSQTLLGWAGFSFPGICGGRCGRDSALGFHLLLGFLSLAVPDAETEAGNSRALQKHSRGPPDPWGEAHSCLSSGSGNVLLGQSQERPRCFVNSFSSGTFQLPQKGTFHVLLCFPEPCVDTAALFDCTSLEHLKTFRTERPVNSAALSPIFDHVVLGGGQEAMDVTTTSTRIGKFEARFFHLAFEEEFGRVKGHFGPINSVAFHPDGKSYSSGGEDGYVRIHYFDPQYFEFEFEA
ncbi:EIF3I factor, partial [Erythrocercus mccallii]|nr:EIF3I factor [Erythrocercus mccallii]